MSTARGHADALDTAAASHNPLHQATATKDDARSSVAATDGN
jgi:hypothetical protein